jgi:hypothetical protein
MYVERFDAEMIQRYLELRGFRFRRNDDGRDFLALISNEQRQLQVRLRVSGSSRNVLTIRASGREHYAAAHRNRLMDRVNQWNREARGPKAYVRETSDSREIAVVGENCYPLSEGIHFEAFTGFVDFTIAGAFELFDKIDRAVELPSAQTLAVWLGNPPAEDD